MSLRETVRDQLQLVTQQEGKVPRRVLFARLILLVAVAFWDLMLLFTSFTLISLFGDYLLSTDLSSTAKSLMVWWCVVSVIVLAIFVLVKTYSKFGVWERNGRRTDKTS